MSTTDTWRIAQRPLAEFAYELKQRYGLALSTSKVDFMIQYDMGEIQLSSVFENLFVATRNQLGKPTRKVATNGYDFVRVDKLGRETPIGDFKTTVLQKDADTRRFVVAKVKNKIGKIYVAAWNWITNKPVFFCIPPDDNGNHPKAGYKIMVHPKTGERTGGWYNNHCAYETWEDMCIA
jgi:hypothetical protein